MAEDAVERKGGITRRDFLKLLGIGAGSLAISKIIPFLPEPKAIDPREAETKLLAENLKFVTTRVPEDEDYSIVAWTKGDKELAGMYTFLTISTLVKNGVDLELIKSVVKSTEIAKIHYSSNGALPGRIEISETTRGIPDLEALSHEWVHEFVWIDKSGINESFAEYFRTEIKGGRDEGSFVFSGCGTALEQFDYRAAANSFGRIAKTLEGKDGPKIIKVAIDTYEKWMKEEGKKRGEYMPPDYFIKELARTYDRNIEDIAVMFEQESPLRCGSLRKEIGLT